MSQPEAIDAAAITAAARAMWDHQFEDGHWDEIGHATGDDRAGHCLRNAELALRAAAPILAKATREQIGREIEMARTDRRDAADDALLAWRDGMEEAAAIARGDSGEGSGNG